MILEYNTFEFNNKIYKQNFWIAMGTRSAPNIANMDMGLREEFILNHKNKHVDRIYMKKWTRFIDDIFFSKVLRNNLIT